MFAGTENFRFESLSQKSKNVAVFFRGIRATVLSLFRGIFFEQNSVPHPRFSWVSAYGSRESKITTKKVNLEFETSSNGRNI
jgi:hypothetical protein